MIKRHGRIWWLDIWVGKKRVRRSLHTDERVIALERARDIEVELRKPRPPGTLFTEFAEKYKEWARQTKPASYRTEAYRIKFIGDWLAAQGAETLEAITPYHVEQLRQAVRDHDRRATKTDRPASKATANRYCALLRTMLNRAADWQMFDGRNPVSRVKFYREPGKARPLTDAEAVRVIRAAEAIQADPYSPIQRVVADLIILLFNTGLRRSEALGLRWRDYSGAEIVVVGKQERRRTVPLNDAARAVIDRQPREGAFILPVPNRLQGDNLRRTVKRIRKLSGVEHFHLHLCRHYAMTKMLASGVDIQTAAEILGHTRLSTSLLYAHSSPERRKRAVETISVGANNGHRPADADAQVAD